MLVLTDQVISQHEQVSVPKSATQLSNAVFKLLLQNVYVKILVLCNLLKFLCCVTLCCVSMLKRLQSTLRMGYLCLIQSFLHSMAHLSCLVHLPPTQDGLCPFLLSSILQFFTNTNRELQPWGHGEPFYSTVPKPEGSWAGETLFI